MKADDDSSNGSAGFIAGGSTGMLSAVTGGTRYKPVVSDNDGYAQVGQGIRISCIPHGENTQHAGHIQHEPAAQHSDSRLVRRDTFRGCGTTAEPSKRLSRLSFPIPERVHVSFFLTRGVSTRLFVVPSLYL